jgi:type I site-specific restriction-modification system R (restriction) subunit
MARKPRRWRKDFPYYKIQTYNNIFAAWEDQARAYTSVEQAREVIQQRFPDRKARIVVVEAVGRHVLE